MASGKIRAEIQTLGTEKNHRLLAREHHPSRIPRRRARGGVDLEQGLQ